MKSIKHLNMERLVDALRSDYVINRGNSKGRFLVLFYRLANYFALIKGQHPFIGFIGLPIVLAYKLIVVWLLGTEIQVKTVIGNGLIIYHGQGLVVHENACIGEHVVIRHNTTIASVVNAQGEYLAPQIEDGVDVGCHSVILGDIKIGKNTVIGAGSVVTSDLPPNCVAAGNPAKVIRMQD